MTELSKRVASEWGGPPGVIDKFSPGKKGREKIGFCTDAKLLSVLRDNPTLEGIDCVVVDEVHERSVNTDLVLGCLKNVLRTRSDLRVVLTSATMDRTVFQRFFAEVFVHFGPTSATATSRVAAAPKEVPVAEVPGRTFPIEDFYEEADARDYVTAAWRKAMGVHRANPTPESGDILVFLATVVDVDRACKAIKQQLGEFSLSFYAQSLIHCLQSICAAVNRHRRGDR